MPDTVGSEHRKPPSLRGRANRARTNTRHRFRDLYRCLDAELLLAGRGDLNKDAASGVDHVTAEAYGANLHANIEALVQRLQSKRTRATLVRRCDMPKGHGKERPSGIPALEDTRVQLACAKLLTAIHAQDFPDCSDGYRPERSALDAVEDLTFDLQDGWYGSLVEGDVQGFFDHIDHAWLVDMVRVRIDDRAFLDLIRTWLKAGIVETDGQVIHPETGTPRGGVISPILANVYVHDALDLWFTNVVTPRCRGEALLCRYADEWVCAFRSRDDAERLYRVLPERLETCNREVAPDTTHLRRFSRVHPGKKQCVTCPGFEFFWKPDRQGISRVMRRTARTKLQAACQRIKAWITRTRHLPGRAFFRRLHAR